MAKPDKSVTIFVNEGEYPFEEERISYKKVIELYLGGGEAPSAEYIVKYSRGHSDNVSGTLTLEKEVKVKDGMRFRVSGTGES